MSALNDDSSALRQILDWVARADELNSKIRAATEAFLAVARAAGFQFDDADPALAHIAISARPARMDGGEWGWSVSFYHWSRNPAPTLAAAVSEAQPFIEDNYREAAAGYERIQKAIRALATEGAKP